ncbi:MAG: histidine phosphatase family protein [Acutalibacter sp.]|nr:histidine phosphatase family protein [Acutalibacter sp.]
MVTTVYIVRHCESTGNVEHRFQGRFDAPITPKGEKQLELLSLRFRNVHLDAIFSSPLERARLTAQAVNRFHDLPIQLVDDLLELDVGEMENLHLDEIGGKFPLVAKNWDETPDLCEFPGGETMAQAYERVNAALDDIIAKNPGKTILLATHGGVIRNIDARVRAGSVRGMRGGAVFGNTGVSILEAGEDGTLSWRRVNDLSHLPEELRRSPTKYQFHTEASGEVL